MPTSIKTRRRGSLVRTNRRKTLRKAESLGRPKSAKTSFIGEGAFGRVSRPPARCDKITVTSKKYENDRNYVSKLTEGYIAKHELELGNYIKKHIPKWKDSYCLVEFICEAPEKEHIQTGVSDYSDTYAITPYCGVTLDKILRDNVIISPKRLCGIIKSLKDLIYSIDDLHEIGVFHLDLHSENVVYNLDDEKLRLIDFNLSEKHPEIIKSAPNSWRNDPIIIKANVKDSEGIIYNLILPLIKYLRKDKFSKSNVIQSCLSKINFLWDEIPHRTDLEGMKSIDLREEYIHWINQFIENS